MFNKIKDGLSKKDKKDKIEKDHVENKTFSYKKNDVGLNFTLRIDKEGQLKDFRDLLEEAIIDIDNIILK